MQDVVFWPWQLVAYRPTDFQHCKIIWDYNFELYFYHSSFSFQKLAEIQELERSHMEDILNCNQKNQIQQIMRASIF